ncbi:MAG: diguanylate cyclase [Rhodospirillaceae bacterium]|jgi:diguanylate cyclase (GGDEF)-like protein|nr:diguanylate cyclase [Rhodospirillaceae bacterium]MBT5194318.1 diguanylate cyclase [Rhodospirillaceae bacterium]MBT5898921.1 diguanylate cyclase [Rhodospirillaceae bacterium]MBT6430962.1 diguanylate cyclase [Rhodospirillaceae bacterium]
MAATIRTIEASKTEDKIAPSEGTASRFNGLMPWITICAVALGLLTTGVTSWVIYDEEEKVILKEFEAEVGERIDVLERELKLNIQSLNQLKILFDHGGDVSSADFTLVARHILVRHVGIQALEWIPSVPKDKRAEFETLRQMEFPNFKFTERLKQGVMTAAKERKVHYPVYYVEPLSANETAFGFDLASSAERLKTLTESRDRNVTLASGGITLVQENASQKAFLVFLPLYDGALVTVEDRRAKHRGFVLGVFRVEDIFRASVLQRPLEFVNFVISDETDGKGDILLNMGADPKGETFAEDKIFRRTLNEIGGRRWRVSAYASEAYLAQRRTFLPVAIFAMGLVFLAFVTSIIVLVSRRAMVTARLVQERTSELQVANEELKKLSLSDGLTGIANRLNFDETLDTEWRRAMRGEDPIAIILIDIDHFKQFNDNYGHQAGDRCLRAVAGALAGVVLRPGDLVARYGGEEFVVILTKASDGALQVAERFRRAVEDLQIPHGFSGASQFVTVSLGVAYQVPTKNAWPQELTSLADKALYRAKEEGRNRVVCDSS